MRKWLILLCLLMAGAGPGAAAGLYAPDDDPREALANGGSQRSGIKTVDLSTTFAGQLPDDPGVYDAPATADGITSSDPDISVSSLQIIWREPTGGVTSTTGVLLRASGVGAENDYNLVHQPLDDSWRDSKNLIIGTVGTRNLAYAPPADHVKLQMTDVLRALGRLQQLYPQYDRRRQYYFGSSGAGWLGMQLAFYCPEQFAEIHAHCGVMKLTTAADQQTSYPGDPVGGWNSNTNFPSSQGALPFWQWERYQAERDLRGPLTSMKNAAASQRIFSSTATDPPLILMSQGNADTVVSFQHFLSMRSALEQFVGQAVQVTDSPDWGSCTALGNWKFTEIYNYDHYYDRVFVSAFSRPDCFTRQRATIPPGTLNYSSPVSHGYVFRLTGSLANAEIHTRWVTAANDWQMYR